MSTPQSTSTTEPLTMSLDLTCPAAHAFVVWTTRIDSWWPTDHTVSGRPDQIVLQGHVGGRIFERTPEGVEHDWGRVTAWDPPVLLAYTWHIGSDPAAATEVEVRFLPRDDDTSRIEIAHRGWDRLGATGSAGRDRNRRGWNALLPPFRAACRSGRQLDPLAGSDRL
jgi:uncharacterized protein YndB with AHSA1/START domain